MDLHHSREECPGRWVRSEERRVGEWRCTHCGAAYAGDDIAARESIWREYEMELLFFRLGSEGRRLLGGDRGGYSPGGERG